MGKIKLAGTKKLSDEDKAREEVRVFEEKREELVKIRDEFAEAHPEANEALSYIKQVEDEVNALRDSAANAVRVAKVSIGEFSVVVPRGSDTYDGKLLVAILCKMSDEDAGELLKKLNEQGFFKSVVVDYSVAKIVVGRDKDLEKQLKPSFVKGEELTPRVTAPKNI